MEALILDMDGVIIDSEPMHFKLEAELLQELGGHISPREQESFVGTTDFYIWTTLKEKFGLEPSVEKIIEMKKERFYQVIDQIPLVDGFMAFLTRMSQKDIKIAIASSNNRNAVERVIEVFKLEEYIDFFISGEEVENSKPNPEIFLKCAKKLGVIEGEVLVVEDAKSGTEAARLAGMKCIGLRNPNSGSQDLKAADLIVDSLEDITDEKIEKLFKKR